MWVLVIVVAIGIALFAVLMSGRRSWSRRSRSVEQPPSPATELVVAGTRTRVTANSSGLVVDRQQGSSWTEYRRLGWDDIVEVEFTVGTYDPVLALWASTGAGARTHLVDSRQLTGTQWSEIVSAVAAWTSGRVIIDLSKRTDPRSITDF